MESLEEGEGGDDTDVACRATILGVTMMTVLE